MRKTTAKVALPQLSRLGIQVSARTVARLLRMEQDLPARPGVLHATIA